MTDNPLNFLNDKKWLTIAVIGSFFIWKLLSSAYDNLLDPFLKKSLPTYKFKFLNKHISGLVKYDNKQRLEMPVNFGIGTFIRDLLICAFIILFLFIIAKNVKT